MAQKCDTPYIPMFEIENVPPWNSSSFSLSSLALAAKSFDSAAICCRPLRFASLMIGVMRPFGVLTAMLMSTFLNCLMKSPCQDEFVHGTCIEANEAAFKIMSLTEIFDLDSLLRVSRSLSSLSTSHSTVT